MGWEMKYANQDVDMRQYNIEALDDLPLGSFIDDNVILNYERRKKYEKEVYKQKLEKPE